jgi:hypothetical protein
MKHSHSVLYTRFSVNSTPMIVGAVLIGAGSLIGLSGMIVGGTAMVSATRQWFRELEGPSVEGAKTKLSQRTAAKMANASAWQQPTASSAPTPR